MEIQHDNTEDIVENWDHPVQINEENDLYKLLQVTARENKRIDLDIEQIYDDRFLESATGVELEKIGKMVDVRRKNGEYDSKLRKRIKANFAAQASDTTFKQFASTALSILETEPGNITINTPPDTPAKVVQIELDGVILDNNPLTKTELIDLMNKVVSVDATVEMVEIGTFAFDGDESNLEGWDEGTWSVVVDN